MRHEVRKHGAKGTRVRLMFEDEARFGCITESRRCWAPKGTRPAVPAQFVREYTYTFAAVSPYDGTLDSLVLPDVNAEMMSIFLHELATRHPHEFIILVLDSAGWHTPRELRIPANMRLIPLPPYSPELNPVEHVWDELREKWFANIVFRNFDALEDHLVHALATLENDNQRIASTTRFPWIINLNLNAT